MSSSSRSTFRFMMSRLAVTSLFHFPVSMIRSSGDLISVTGVLISWATWVKNAILAWISSFSFFSPCRRRMIRTPPTISSTTSRK